MGKIEIMKNLSLLLIIFAFLSCSNDTETKIEEPKEDLTEAIEASESDIEISEIDVTSQPILYIEEQSKLEGDSIAIKLGKAYGEIMTFLGENELEMMAAPMAITTKFSMEEMFWAFNAAIAVEIPEDIELTGRIKAGTSYEGKVVKAIHIGPYSESMITYEALEQYVKDNNLEMNGQPWEEYVDDPTQIAEKDLRTFIYYPVK